MRLPLRLALAAALLFPATAARSAGLGDAIHGTYWGEPAEVLQRQLGSRALTLPRPIDFGDSYAPLVMRGVPVGGIDMIAYYQIGKATHGLKRIQLERPRHAVNASAFRAVFAALQQQKGAPDVQCGLLPGAASGYQGAAEYVWRRGGLVVRAIFRDTTLEALGGCYSPACGLTAQLLLRVSPPAADNGACPATPAGGRSARTR